ncbi:MAG: hypothetical protein AB8F94_15660 [Saprospiraceae bacterium]
MPKKWIIVSLVNMLIAVSIGALLRFAYIEEISWLAFKNFLHAHSHVAMLGWVYLALFTFLVSTFLPKDFDLKKYNNLFWLTQVSVLGMLVTFPQMGYASWSIGFSVMHTLLSYIFIFFFLRDLKRIQKEDTNAFTISNWFVKSSLFFMIFSTLGLWAMGPIMVNDMQGEAVYYMTIQFYLHFQFNGWFIFAILALLFKFLEKHHISVNPQDVKRFFFFLSISTFLTYALAVTWANPLPILFYINSSGVILQLVALYYFIKVAKVVWEQLQNELQVTPRLLFKLSLFSFVFKILIQSAVIIPTIAIVGYTIRNYAMGFLHLMLIGMVTLFLFGFAAQMKLIRLDNLLGKIGIRVFIVGFILSEAVLFLQGTMFWGAMGFMPYYYELLFGVSAMLPFGLFLIITAQLQSGVEVEKNSDSSLDGN